LLLFRIVSYLTLLTYMIDCMRDSITTLSAKFTADVAVLIAWLIALQAFAVVVLKKGSILGVEGLYWLG